MCIGYCSIEELKILKQKKISLEVVAPNISITTCELIDKMMDKSPDNRHNSYHDLLEEFGKAQNVLSQSSVRLVGSSLRVEKNQKSNKYLKVGLLVSLLSTIIVFLVFLNSRNEFISDINSSFDITDDNLEYVDIGDPKQFMTERFEGLLK